MTLRGPLHLVGPEIELGLLPNIGGRAQHAENFMRESSGAVYK